MNGLAKRIPMILAAALLLVPVVEAGKGGGKGGGGSGGAGGCLEYSFSAEPNAALTEATVRVTIKKACDGLIAIEAEALLEVEVMGTVYQRSLGASDLDRLDFELDVDLPKPYAEINACVRVGGEVHELKPNGRIANSTPFEEERCWSARFQ